MTNVAVLTSLTALAGMSSAESNIVLLKNPWTSTFLQLPPS
jgi:hypothetical protein